MASFNLNVKQEQLTAPEVNEWNVASLIVGVVLFSCWPLVWESLFSWYICSTHKPQLHGESSNAEPARWTLQCAGPVHEAMGSKENQCAIEKMCNTERFYFKPVQGKKIRNKPKAWSSEVLTEQYRSELPLERCVTCSLDCHNTLGCCKNSWQCLTDRQETCDPKLWCFPFHDEMNAALDRGWNTSVCGGSAILGPFLFETGVGIARDQQSSGLTKRALSLRNLYISPAQPRQQEFVQLLLEANMYF